MTRTVLRLAPGFFVLAALGACKSGYISEEKGEKIEKAVDDDNLATRIQIDIAKDEVCGTCEKIRVRVKEGVAILYGEVETEAQRERAGAIALAVQGVRTVDNRLSVTNPASR